MASTIGTIAQLLDATLDPSQHKKAENALKKEQVKPQYSLHLLNIVASEALPAKTRLAAALAFKNFIRTNYVNEDGNYKISEDEVRTIKEQLIGLMIACPPTIQTQLGEAISIIADSDFWERWNTLTQELVSRFSESDPKINIGVLEVAHSIFVRWRPLYRTDELYTEINHVINTFCAPFVQLLVATDRQIDANQTDRTALKGWFDTLSLLIKIFYDLSCHDMPPIFEQHLGSISELLLKYLTYKNNVLDTDDDTEASVVDLVKADICEVLQLYTTKFDDDFRQYSKEFIPTTWGLLSAAGPETKYDVLVSKALHFLTAIAGTQEYAHQFNNGDVLSQVIEKVILPNVALRESDVEMFEDEPIEFIRRDLEGSDTDSRRRSATDLLKKLQEKFDPLVTNVMTGYINHYLEQGKTDWKAKDTAIYLFLSVASKGAVTAGQGVMTVNPLVDVVQWFEHNIWNDLKNDEGVEPIAKVDAIKYLHTFRSQLTKQQWMLCFQPLIRNMASKNYVVYTYAAITVERVLFLTDGSGKPLFPREDIEPFAKDLLDHLFQLIEMDKTPAKLQENEFLMRCVMRILIVIKDGTSPILENVLSHLILITNAIKQNPSNPRFYYYHFEALGALVRYCSAKNAALFNQTLWEPFHQILQEDVTEFIPYVLQILAQLLESSPADTISDNYRLLLEPLLQPPMWEVRGNVPAAVRMLSALIPRTSAYILSENKLVEILGIFQRLVSSKKLDSYSFEIIEAIVKSYEPSAMDQYFQPILNLLFTRLQASPADSFKLRFARFFHVVSARLEAGYGTDYFIKHSDSMQDGLFKQIYPAVILPETPKLARPVDRKIAVISYTKTICDSEAFATLFAKGWARSTSMLLSLLVNPPTIASGFGDEIIAEADVDDIGFGLTYTALNTCKAVARDDYPEITDVRQWAREYISQADGRHRGAITRFVTERLTPEERTALNTYLS